MGEFKATKMEEGSMLELSVVKQAGSKSTVVFKWVMGFKKEVLSQAFMREVDLECFKNYLY